MIATDFNLPLPPKLPARGNLKREQLTSLSGSAVRYGLPVLLSPLSLMERLHLRRVDLEGPIAPPPVFIIGAPRSGSTILYQLLSNAYEFDFISNFSALAYRSLYFGIRAQRRLLGTAPHNSFESRYGRTRGLRSPNECGKFWYQWFPKDRHFVSAGEIDPSRLWRLRATIVATASFTGRPLLFKNLNCGQRLQVLRQVLPEALFVFVRRDPVMTAQSILHSRVSRYGSKERWISVMPPNHTVLRKQTYVQQVMGQVYHLERQITDDLGRFPRAQWLVIRYEDLCADTEQELVRIEGFLQANRALPPHRHGAAVPTLRPSARPSVDSSDLLQLQLEANRLDWSRVLEPDDRATTV